MAQDTVLVDFKFGSARITNSESKKLDSLPILFDVFQLDSIQYIGMTDTVGNSDANFKLSLKRAEAVFNHSSKILPEYIKTNIIAIGESNQFGRQVAVIMHYKPNYLLDTSETIVFQDVDSGCFYIDYTLLNTSHIRVVEKRKKEYIYIETVPINMQEIPDYFNPIDFNNTYYGEFDKDGKFVAKKIKWKSRRTGTDWWAQKRYIATIPKASFDRFKVFMIQPSPCSDCHLNVTDSIQKHIMKQERHLDNFIINTFQFKRKLFNRKKVKIRAPREYIDTTIDYFEDKTTREAIVWDEKRAKRKQTYVYAKIKSRPREDFQVYRNFNYCYVPPEYLGDGGSGLIRPCRRVGGTYEKQKNWLLAEYGSTLSNQTFTPYLGLYFNNDFRGALEYGILIGSDYEFNGFGLARVRYNFYTMRLGKSIQSANVWCRPPTSLTNYWVAKFYLGIENQTQLFSGQLDFNENNGHIGLELENYRPRSRFNRFFIQYGPQYRYNTNFIDSNNFGYLRFGGVIRLLPKK